MASLIILVAVVAATLHAGGQTEPKAAAGDGRMVITWMGHNDKVFPEGNQSEALIEQKFNVDIRQTTVPAGPDEEKVILYFTEGKEADLINVWSNATFRKLAEQGVIRSIPEEWLYKYMPTWMSKVEGMVGKETVKSQMYFNGKVYGAPMTDYANTMPYVMIYRKDWMDKVGVSKVPTTLDEMFELLKRFTFNDPDGNGKNDTYGIHNDTHGSRKFSYIFGAFGLNYNTYYINDGKVMYANVQPEFRNALKVLNSWYKAGVIDPEFVTDDRNIQRKKLAEGRFGAVLDHPWWMANSTQNNIIQIVKDSNPKADFVLAPPPKGPNGKSGAPLYYPALYDQGAVFFGRNTSDEKVMKIMQIKEEFAKSQEFWLQVYHGEAGKQYDVDASGKIVKRSLTDTELANLGLGSSYALQPETLENAKPLLDAKDLELYTGTMKLPVLFYGVSFPVSRTNEAAKAKGADIATMASEFFYSAVTGKVDIDKGWDNYVASLMNAGLKDILAEYQIIYQGK